MSLTKGACTYRLSVCLASCAVCMQACECCVRARVRFSVACMGAYVRVFVSACVRVSVARQHACVCMCQCCTPTCVRVLRACMCTCGVRLHVSRLTFSSLVIRFSSRWIRNQGPPVYHQTPRPPEPLATTGRTASPRRPRPAHRPMNAPHRPSFFSGDPHPTSQ